MELGGLSMVSIRSPRFTAARVAHSFTQGLSFFLGHISPSAFSSISHSLSNFWRERFGFTPMAQAACLSSFCNFVGLIISGGSDKEMVWVDTRRVIAGVTDNHTVRDWPSMDGPRVAMCSPHLTSDWYNPIATSKTCSGPQPATGRIGAVDAA